MLICFQLTDEVVRNLTQSSRKLKYLNLSRSPTIKDRFLRDLGHSCKETPLKSPRNCLILQPKEILELCNSLLKGNTTSIQHIDVSNNDGRRFYKPKFPVEKLKKERSDVTFAADFPLARSSSWIIKGYRVCDEWDEEDLREIEKMEAKNDGEKMEANNDGVHGDDSDDDNKDSSDGTGEDDSEDDIGCHFP
ncbi:hypothetical protein Bca52824_023890 [Brassica carinata]|uniref:Uncharacterized protein n=1 Tax=Brassica carinata TaxID=52824 RepID=A0A8X7VIL6_BRACI|nr:hypothetical protein Bca52824_023890 [Brassica carinata]